MIVANTTYKVVIATKQDLKTDKLQVTYDERETRVSIRISDPMFNILYLTLDECSDLRELLAEILEAAR